MKYLLNWSGNFIIISASVLCTMGALISAFSFNVDIHTLSVVCLTTVVALSAFITIWRGKGVLLLIFPAMAAIAWNLDDIIRGAKWVAFFITNEYSKWLSVSVLFPGVSATAYEQTLFFAAAGTLLAFMISVALCSRSSASLIISFTAPSVSLTLILTEYHANYYFLLGLVAIYLTLIITSALHPPVVSLYGTAHRVQGRLTEQDDANSSFHEHQKGRAIFFALAITAIIMGITYLAAPPDSQRRGELAILVDSHVRGISERVGVSISNADIGWPETFTGIWRFNTRNVAVADAGRRIITDRGLLEINSTHAGTFYLRGYSMQFFDGRTWSYNPDMSMNHYHEEELSMLLPRTIAEATGRYHPDSLPLQVSMAVKTTGDSSYIIYQPYYTYAVYLYGHDIVTYIAGFYHMANNIFDLASALPPGTIDGHFDELNMLIARTYTQIDSSTAHGLRELAAAQGISANAPRALIADQVAEYVSSAARYTLSPHIIPRDEDFAIYFLEYSREGYCIHFATVATLMLRSLGVPARFTSGFTVTVPEDMVGEIVVITDRQAHAWVEVYYDDIGWVYLEVTPASWASGVPGRLQHSTSEAGPAPGGTGQPEPGRASAPPSSPRHDEARNDSESQPGNEHGPGNVFSIVIFITICALLLFLYRFIAFKLRKKGFTQEDTNAAVIYAWGYISRLARNNPPPDKIHELAFKARFSQHRISEDERDMAISYATRLSREVINSKGLVGRLWLKHVWRL